MVNQAYILTKVREAFKAAFDIDPQFVSIESSASDIPAWDSVSHISLASELEQAFDVCLDVDELIEMENVREIVRVIEMKLSQKALT